MCVYAMCIVLVLHILYIYTLYSQQDNVRSKAQEARCTNRFSADIKLLYVLCIYDQLSVQKASGNTRASKYCVLCSWSIWCASHNIIPNQQQKLNIYPNVFRSYHHMYICMYLSFRHCCRNISHNFTVYRH